MNCCVGTSIYCFLAGCTTFIHSNPNALRVWYIIMFVILVSCNNNKLKEVLVSNTDKYWHYENNCGSHGVYFKFKNDGTYDNYNKYLDNSFVLFNNDGDLIGGERKWFSTSSTTLKIDGSEYKVESFNENKIILSNIDDEKKVCKVILEDATGNKNVIISL